MTVQSILNRLDDAGKKQLFKDLHALINFNFESQNEKEFEDSVKPGLLRINEKLKEVYDAALRSNDKFRICIIKNPSNIAFMESIKNENSKSLFKYYKESIDDYLKGSKSLYNLYDAQNTGDEYKTFQLIHDLIAEMGYNYYYNVQGYYCKKLTEIDFNDNDNSFNEFKDLCEVIHAVYAFKDPQQKKHLSVICNDDYQLNNQKINDLYKKFQLIADKDTGQISEETLAEYTSDRTVMDFIRMILSYLPQVMKDAIGLNEESGNKWQKKIKLEERLQDKLLSH